MANVLIGILMLNYSVRSYLLTCKTLNKKEQQKKHNFTVAQCVNDGLKLMWPLGGNDEKVLMLSDTWCKLERY